MAAEEPASASTSIDAKQSVELPDEVRETGGFFRGVAAAFRSSMPAVRGAIRSVGEARTLAFASEGGVAGKNLISKPVYYGAWGLSGIAILADITTKTWDAAPEKRTGTCLYNVAFHIPASLVVPAVIIHQIVHGMEHSVKHHSYAKGLPPRAKAVIPVAAALLAIIPVVPAVDHVAEMVMEPTLGAYLGLEFEHHHGDHGDHAEGDGHAEGEGAKPAADAHEKAD